MKRQAKTFYATGRLPKGKMNKLEEQYAATLEEQKQQGIVLWYEFEAMTFKLADRTSYTPDFAVMLNTGELQCHEVKGFWQDTARVKIKVAAAKFPIHFIAVKAKAKKDGGGWMIEEF